MSFGGERVNGPRQKRILRIKVEAERLVASPVQRTSTLLSSHDPALQRLRFRQLESLSAYSTGRSTSLHMPIVYSGIAASCQQGGICREGCLCLSRRQPATAAGASTDQARVCLAMHPPTLATPLACVINQSKPRRLARNKNFRGRQLGKRR